MDDMVLQSRLIALNQELGRVAHPEKTLEEVLKLGKDEMENLSLLDTMRDSLYTLMFDKVQPMRDRLAEIREGLNSGSSQVEIEQAWKEFHEVKQKSQEIFQEYAEWIGGLAFRAKAIDGNICQVADQLITSCSSVLRVSPPISIPAQKEVRAKTICNLLRLRFPEWSIWSLPLIAHEYGHVFVDELIAQDLKNPGPGKAGLKEFLEDQRSYFVKHVPELQDLVDAKDFATEALRLAGEAGTADQDLMERGRAHVKTLEEAVRSKRARVEEEADFLINECFVDSFGTYVLGPAYACAAVFTRLNPILPPPPARQWDHDRAEVIIAMLEKINEQSRAANPYGNIIAKIRENWDKAVKFSNPAGTPGVPLDPARSLELRNLVDRFWDKLENRSSFKLRYSFPTQSNQTLSEDGWQIAQAWANDWIDTLKNELRLNAYTVKLPKVPEVRDALNMAWICRLRSPGSAKEVGEHAHDLCLRIARARRISNDDRNPPR